MLRRRAEMYRSLSLSKGTLTQVCVGAINPHSSVLNLFIVENIIVNAASRHGFTVICTATKHNFG